MEFSFELLKRPLRLSANSFSLLDRKFTIDLSCDSSGWCTLSLQMLAGSHLPPTIRWTAGSSTKLFDREYHLGKGSICCFYWSTVMPNEGSSVSITINMQDDKKIQLFNNLDCSDVQVHVKGQVLFLHRCILSKASPIFKSMFASSPEVTRIDIDDVSYSALKYGFSYLYNEAENPQAIDFRDVCRLASKYEIDLLLSHSIEMMQLQLSHGNCLEMLRFAMDHDYSLLHFYVLEYMKFHAKTVFPAHKRKLTEEFGEVTSKRVVQMFFG